MSTTTPSARRRLTAVLATLLLSPITGLVAPAAPAPAAAAVGRSHGSVPEPGRRVRALSGRAGSADTGFGRALVGSAPVGRGPSELAVNPRTHTIYVTNGNAVDGPNAGGDTVSVIDTRRCHSGDVSRCHGPWPTIVVGNRTPDDLPSGVAVDVATDTVYVANAGANSVSVFDGATCNAVITSGCGQVPAEVPVGAGPLALTIDPISDTAYVANSSGTSVSMLDTRRCNAAHLSGCPTTAPPAVDVAANPFNVDTDERSHTAYVTTIGDHNGWAVFDTRTCNARRQSGCTTPRPTRRGSGRSERREGRPRPPDAVHRRLRQHDLGVRPPALPRGRSLRLCHGRARHRDPLPQDRLRARPVGRHRHSPPHGVRLVPQGRRRARRGHRPVQRSSPLRVRHPRAAAGDPHRDRPPGDLPRPAARTPCTRPTWWTTRSRSSTRRAATRV